MRVDQCQFHNEEELSHEQAVRSREFALLKVSADFSAYVAPTLNFKGRQIAKYGALVPNERI